MKAIILAAGRGSRMAEGTKDKVKCLTQLQGHSLLEYGLFSLKRAGIQDADIGIVTGYQAQTLDGAVSHYFHNQNWDKTNMVVSLMQAQEWLRREPCLVCYSDIVYEAKTIQRLMNSTAEIAITYTTNYLELWSKRFDNPLDDLETLIVEAGQIRQIGQPAENLADIQGQYMGLLLFRPAGWVKVESLIGRQGALPKSLDVLDMTTLLQALVTDGQDIQAIPTDDFWLECDDMNDVSLYENTYVESLTQFWNNSL